MDSYKKSQNISHLDTLRGNMEIGVLEKNHIGQGISVSKKRIYSVNYFTTIPLRKTSA